MTAAVRDCDRCSDHGYVQRDQERLEGALERLERRLFEEELPSIREAIETETTRRREDMARIDRKLDDLAKAVTRMGSGGGGRYLPGLMQQPLTLPLLAAIILGFILTTAGHDILAWLYRLVVSHS